jgi:hypothetical protein
MGRRGFGLHGTSKRRVDMRKPRKGSAAEACQKIAPLFKPIAELGEIAYRSGLPYRLVASLLRASMKGAERRDKLKQDIGADLPAFLRGE